MENNDINVTGDEDMAEIPSGESIPVVDTQDSGGRMTGVFRDRDDRWNFVDYVLAVCGNMKGMSPDLESLRREIRIAAVALPTKVEFGSEEEREAKEKILDNLERLSRGDKDDDGDVAHPEGCWAVLGDNNYEFGYGDGTTARLKGYQKTPINHYKVEPPKIHWDLIPVEQEVSEFFTEEDVVETRFFMTSAAVKEVDSVCAVPAMSDSIGMLEAGLRVLNNSRADNEWQRDLDAKRMHIIGAFISDNDNIIANSPMIYANTHESVRIYPDDDGEWKMEIDFEFLRMNGAELSDSKEGKDLRPLWLIDGQHRIRGMRTSKRGHLMKVPLIIFPPEFKVEKAAKIFAEINTLQTPLKDLHELFMMHRFSIPNKKRAKRNFDGEKEDVGWNFKGGSQSRANTLSYRLAATLVSQSHSPLHEQIRMLPMNERKSVIKATQWVDFARDWFLSGPYGLDTIPEEMSNMRNIYEEVRNYFDAFIHKTCNHVGWEDTISSKPVAPRTTGEDASPSNNGQRSKGSLPWRRWVLDDKNEPVAKGKSLLQQQTIFPVMIWLYPHVVNKILNQHGKDVGRPFSVDLFEEALKPLKNVDWLDRDLMAWASGGGEQGRRAIYAWMESALLSSNESSYPLTMGVGDYTDRMRGREILRPLKSNDVELFIDPKTPDWPEGHRDRVSIIAVRPMASLPTSRWSVFDDRGVNQTETETMNVPLLGDLGDKREYRIHTGRDGLKRYTIGRGKINWAENSDFMRIRVEWKNNHTPPAHKEIKWYRDGNVVHLNADGTDGDPVEVMDDTSIMD